jgi:hypothetical protein
MRREDVAELFQKIPPIDVPKAVLCLRSGLGITVDYVYKLEPVYIVVRGREAGTNDDGRGFFVPYEEISYIKLDRSVKINELRKMYGEPTVAEAEEGGAVEEAATAAAPGEAAKPAPAPAMDPASIAKQNLLDRIRAARTQGGKR